jgi:uncharacterized membrane protein YphA (DoxX/SURF4 family)
VRPLPRRLHQVVSRFAIAYWALFCIPQLLGDIGAIAADDTRISSMWDPLAVWLGHHVLGITGEIPTAFNGSGDKTSDWLCVLTLAVLSAIVTVVWSVVDRRTQDDPRVREGVRVVVRYTLAFTMLAYGVIKILVLQFRAPNTGRLLQRYGDSSPMGLLWTFMGASPTYVRFAGCMETLGAALLVFRRTTLLGALVLAGVLTNVVMLNFCYDVPVKVHSAHFLAMSLFLLMPDLGRLANVIVLQRPTQPVTRDLVLPKRWMRVARLVVKYTVVSLVVITTVRTALQDRPAEQHTWYDGYWNVTKFARDGQEVPALVTDATRWKRIKFEAGEPVSYVRWRFMDESYGDLYTVTIDDKAQAMVFVIADSDATKPGASSAAITFRYTRSDADHLEVTGNVGGKALTVELQRFVPDKMLLTSRGFHWINEVPFNR